MSNTAVAQPRVRGREEPKQSRTGPMPLEDYLGLAIERLSDNVERLRTSASLFEDLVNQAGGDRLNPLAGAFGTVIDAIADDIEAVNRGLQLREGGGAR